MLCDIFKIDVLRAFLQNCKNIQQLFNISCNIFDEDVKNTRKMLFVWYFENWHPGDIPKASPCRCHLRMLSGHHWDVFPTVKHSKPNVLVFHSTHLMRQGQQNILKLKWLLQNIFITDILGMSQEHHTESLESIIWMLLRCPSKIQMKIEKLSFLFHAVTLHTFGETILWKCCSNKFYRVHEIWRPWKALQIS